MAPKSPRNKKATINKNAAIDTAPQPPIDYGEAQTDEIEALKAIFMEDFEEIEIKSAWSKTTDRSFKLRLRSFSDEESYVILTVRLTATYPRSIPLLEVQGLQDYHERTQKRILNIVANRPRQLLGDVMVHTIASDIQDALEDAVQARQQGTLPSLEEERATAEEVASALAKQADEEEAQRKQEAQDEEDRLLKQMVNEEIGRRERRRMSRQMDIPPLETGESKSDEVKFDQPGILTIRNEVTSFSALTILDTLTKGRDREILLAKPQLTGNVAVPLVMVKRLVFEKSREYVVELERLLETVCTLRHTNIMNLLVFRMERLDLAHSRLVVCHEYNSRGTLKDVLELGGLHLDKARQFTIQLLEALEYIHHNGIGHGHVSPSYVVIADNPITPKLADLGYVSISPDEHEVPSKWRPPEGKTPSNTSLRKSDIWEMGVLVIQMVLGLRTPNEYSSPQVMLSRLNLSNSFEDFLHKIFASDLRKRPSAFDLLPNEFLRTDEPALELSRLQTHHPRSTSSAGLASPLKRRSRHNSSNVMDPMSRYAADFTEIGRLGKGGFGEVAKARNKLDGGIYAIKKIKQAPQLLDQVISEVMLLNRLNHPYVVRYFSTWLEEEVSGGIPYDSSTTATETGTELNGTGKDTEVDASSSDGPRIDFGYQSTGGLDFVSSSGFPQVEFGDDDSDNDGSDIFENDDDGNVVFGEDGEDAVESGEDSDGGRLAQRKSRSESRKAPSMLYIQMEYCERHTLRDLVRKAMSEDEAWRYVRQITEGLAHIHGHGIIHRDLKPDNVFIDVAGNPKIGDFGLATTTQYQATERTTTMSGRTGGDLTRSVGTTLYVAPELRSSSGTTYSDKVDMYSLGIIFYEMCEPFGTAMERIRALQAVRRRDFQLPAQFHPNRERAAQGKLISCLISHKPSERPSSTELLRSDILPVKIEDETIRQALSGLSDPRSPYHQKMMSALFAHDSAGATRVKALAWDARAPASLDNADRLRLRNVARQTIETIFKRHGAEEAKRQTIFPRSSYNTNANVVQLLDASGNLLQLPYDLTVPYARQLAQQPSDVRCTYTFGNAYRDNFSGGPPRASEEVDFDIVNRGSDLDKAFDDSEILKVMDEVACEMPLFSAPATISFHISHASLLNAILDFCRVPAAQHSAVKEILSRLGFNQHNWSKTRSELRKFGLPDTTLDDMQQFDFREPLEKALPRLKTSFEDADSRIRTRVDIALRALKEIIKLSNQLGILRKMYVVPLASVKATFYEGGALFQCVLERKSNRLVIAAGGRYDSLIKGQLTADTRNVSTGAVGIAISLDFIISTMARNSEGPSKKTFLKDHAVQETVAKRCDVLVIANGSDAVRDAGVKVLSSLWSSEISAELSSEGRAAKSKDYSFIVTLRHEASNSVRVSSTSDDSDDNDVPIFGLVSYLQQELRERESVKARPAALPRQPSQHEVERKSNVHVLLARHGSKKSNKYQIVGDAQQQWAQKLDEAKNAPILAVETRDEVLDQVSQTRLSDPESWRRTVQGVQLNDRQYVQQIHEMLQLWRKDWLEGDGMREACVFNFRTQHCIYYDLGT